jgi:uncharacterized protein YlxP (DUF503 family)
MEAAALRIELRIPEARSLKAKRAALRPVVEGLRNLASVSVAEVDHHDAWQRSTIGVAVVASDPPRLDRLIESVRRYVDGQLDVEVVEMGLAFLEDPV